MTPLVLVHGFMGGGDQWQLQADLGNGRPIIAMDLPGFGRHADQPPISRIEDFATWVLEELSCQGVGRFDLMGHSMGGMIVQEMVRLAPDRVMRLILYGTGAVGALPGRFEPIETSKARAQEDGPQATARRIAATWFLHGEDAAGYETCAHIAEKSRLPAILAGLDAMQAWSGEAHLEHIRQATLVIWGDRDRTYPWAQTERLWQKVPDSSLAVVPGAAHAVHLEKPGLFNQIVRDWLRDA